MAIYISAGICQLVCWPSLGSKIRNLILPAALRFLFSYSLLFQKTNVWNWVCDKAFSIFYFVEGIQSSSRRHLITRKLKRPLKLCSLRTPEQNIYPWHQSFKSQWHFSHLTRLLTAPSVSSAKTIVSRYSAQTCRLFNDVLISLPEMASCC